MKASVTLVGSVIETKAKCPQKFASCVALERVRGPGALRLSIVFIGKHKTLMCFRCKFGSVMCISYPTPGTKYFEITYIWLLTSDKFIRCLLEELVKIHSVDDVACSINGFRPTLAWCLVFVKHSASHLNESPVLALHY